MMNTLDVWELQLSDHCARDASHRFERPPEQATYRLPPTLCLDRNSSGFLCGSRIGHAKPQPRHNQPYTVVQAPALREGVQNCGENRDDP